MSPAPAHLLARTGSLRRSLLASVLALVCAAPALADWQSTRLIDRREYTDRLRAMWLGEVIANWTGIPVEGRWQGPPFATDANWGDPGGATGFITNQNPWWADDDTDVEYVYLDALASLGEHGPVRLTGEQIRSAWIPHINRAIWVSNATARSLMDRGVTPPSTSLGCANTNSLMIDAQLTTEFFGALAPGMPEVALDIGALPVRTTAYSHAAHAAQVYMIWYALATQSPADLSPADRTLWILRNSRRLIPDTSKAADIIDFVLADYLANPDKNDWESTRDKVYARYQNPRVAPFEYRSWVESSVNFASGVTALLYGQGDYKRTIQIGVLCGWDCDNAPATLGGLFGLMLGYDGLQAQFPGVNFSDRFWISRTRDALPDYLPLDAGAEDTFTLMAQRCAAIVDRVVEQHGGRVSHSGGTGGEGQWLLPPAVAISPDPAGAPNLASSANPETLEGNRSNNVRRRLAGSVSASSSVQSNPPFIFPWPYGLGGTSGPAQFCNAVEFDPSGVEQHPLPSLCYSTQNPSNYTPGTEQTFTVLYSPGVPVRTVRFVEGPHFAAAGPTSDPNVPGGGGWFQNVTVELLIGGQWTALPMGATQSEPLNDTVPFQIIDWSLPTTVQASGVRLRGVPGGGIGAGAPFVTIAELDTLDAPSPPLRGSFDLSADGVEDTEDLYQLWTTGAPTADLTGDGLADEQDSAYLQRAIRWDEPAR